MTQQLNLEQRCKIAAWQEVFQSPVTVQREFRKLYGCRTAPSCYTIYSIHLKFVETGSVHDKTRYGRSATVVSEENAELLQSAFAQIRESQFGGLMWN